MLEVASHCRVLEGGFRYSHGSLLQIDNNLAVYRALVSLIALADNEVPNGALASIGSQLSPFGASKDQLPLLGP